MGYWRSLTLSLLLLLLLPHDGQGGRNVKSNLCKWCNNTYPVCKDQECYSNCDLSSYCEKSEEICVSIWKQDNESIRVSTLCHNPQLPVENVMVPKYNTSQCVMVRQHNEEGIFYICGCVNEQECNDKLIFEKHTNGYSMLQSKEIIPVAAISLLPPLLVAIMITVTFYLCRTHKQRRRAKEWPQKQVQHHPLPEPSRATSYDEILSVKIDHRVALSTACANNINHNTELLPIELDERVGKGQFAEVWRAKLKHASSGQYETVAVKIFPCEDYASWKNESQIFSDANLKHDSILQFLTAEERHSGLQKEYWLITAYHNQGNLKDYLSRNVLSWRDLQKMAGSLVSGVAHLHSDYTACGSPKIPIAHRDIKSTNILIKNEQECVLCDFGIALRLDPALSVEDFANSGQVGTARYMAPEVLESRVNLEDLESFKQMDVYSMALVLWEIASRCDAIGEVKNYELPFGSKVREQPCMEVMRDVVLHGRGRPEIPGNWLVHQGMHFLCDTITECWDHDPEARLTAHCVAERFNLMVQTDCDDILNNNNNSSSSHGSSLGDEASKMGCPIDENQGSDRNIQ
ncbi:TGF-beta receptor type-2-like isoform X1 [Lacerta agilis]|uniref:TGF-beta receptor type-2-like isoform X1 n=2 Tax=Lacerta agilis TaxID=80427 RepID=UPI001419213F|nr:TGF-beta receptor type-2-like isoform X1 [Lacerta agilis]